MDGFDVEGSSGVLLDVSSGAATVTINDIHADGVGLLSVYGLNDGNYMVSNNEVVGADSGIYVGFSASTSSATVTANLSVIDNHFVDVGNAMYYTAYAYSGAQLDVNVNVEGNEFSCDDRGLYMYSSAWSEAVLNVDMVIDDNTMVNGGSNYFSFHCSYTAEINRNIEITNNNIEVDGGAGLYFWSGVDEYVDYNDSILIEGNHIQAAYNGIYNSFTKEYDESEVDRDWKILNNTVEDCSSGAVYLWQSYTGSERGECNYDLLLDGNTFRNNAGGGLYFSQYISESGTSAINHTITRNNIEGGGGTAIWLSVFAETADIDHNVVIRGNVLDGSASGSGQVGLSVHHSEDGSYDLDLDMGNPSAFGYNTIVADGDNPNSYSLYLHVHPSSSLVTADLNVVGNWWGTQDAGEIEDRVYHGPDSSEYFTADLSNPLPDSLDFTAVYVDGEGLIVTAGADAGFVAYAGNLVMTGSLTGPGGFSEGGDVDADWVTDDYQTLLVAVSEFDSTPPPGEYQLCLTNPGGQTGCTNFTIGDGGGEDCSQNQIPKAVSDSAETPEGTSVLIDLTANDDDVDGNMDPTAVTITQLPNQGTLVNNGDGTVTYTPNEGTGQTGDSFNYTVSDTCGATSNIATCQVLVNAGEGGGEGGGDNQIPTANYDGAETEMETAVTIDILANDSDADGDALDEGSVVITQAPHKGSVVDNGDGTVTYTPNEGVAGTSDTFNYTVDDEHGATSNIATVSVSILFDTEAEKVSGGVGGNSGRTGTPGTRGGGVGNTGTVGNGGTRTP